MALVPCEDNGKEGLGACGGKFGDGKGLAKGLWRKGVGALDGVIGCALGFVGCVKKFGGMGVSGALVDTRCCACAAWGAACIEVGCGMVRGVVA